MSKNFQEIPMAEPYRIKVVEPVGRLPRAEREAALKRAGNNPFMLKSEEVYIDIQTDSGTAAMSDAQWAAIMTGDEAYSGSKDFFKLEKAVKEILGYPYFFPTHQGRGAENILLGTIAQAGKWVVSNQFFGTGASHLVYNGARCMECVCDEAHDNDSDYPFKGNIDLEKVKAFVNKVGVDNIGFFIMTCTNNPGGGQPVSMANLKEISAYAKSIGKRLFLDFARFGENMYFIKQKEEGYADKSIVDILHEFTSYSDGCMISAKKDGLVNIGGLLCMRERELYLQCAEREINFEGFLQYGGLAGRDMAALAQGIHEVVKDDYLEGRIQLLQSLGDKFDATGVPYLHPVGGHAIYVNANRVYPHIPQSEFPALVFACELYLESGVRCCEMGSLCKGFDPDTGEQIYAPIDLCRLAFGRRAYTSAHYDYVAEACRRVVEKAHKRKRGLLFDKEERTQSCRYFISTFKWAE